MVHCCVIGCKSRSERKLKNITFHSFTKDTVLRDMWIKSTGRRHWTLGKNTRICSKHFNENCFRKTKHMTFLNASSVPTLFIHRFPICSNSDQRVEIPTTSTADPVVQQDNYIEPSTSTKSTEMDNCSTMDEDEINSNSLVNERSIIECRTCLHIMSPDAVLFNIFEKWTPIQEGRANTIAEDLEYITNVKMQQSDRHSKVICRACYELLHSACTFRLLVRQNNQILEARHSEEQKTDNIWPKPIQVDKSINSSIQENSVNAEIKQELQSDDEYDDADNNFENGEDFANMDIKVEPEEMIQQQPSQQFVVNGSMSLHSFEGDMTHLTNGTSGEHLLTKIKEEPLSEEETDVTQTDLPLQCLLCAKDFHSVTGLKAHVIAQHSYKSVKRKNNNCISPERNKNFTTPTDLMVHETCHNKSVCYGCNQGFDTFEQLTKHSQTCKAIASQEHKIPKTLDDVLRPQSQEEGANIKCPNCDETFSDMYYVAIHQEIHHSSPGETAHVEDGMQVEMLENIFSDNSGS